MARTVPPAGRPWQSCSTRTGALTCKDNLLTSSWYLLCPGTMHSRGVFLELLAKFVGSKVVIGVQHIWVHRAGNIFCGTPSSNSPIGEISISNFMLMRFHMQMPGLKEMHVLSRMHAPPLKDICRCSALCCCLIRQWAEAYETSVRGLEWSVRRRASGCETLTHFALSLRLCAARCLRRLKRLDEAEYAFKVLAGGGASGP